MEKNNFEQCIEAVNVAKNIAEEIKTQLLNKNSKEDIGTFNIVYCLCKELAHAAYWAEQLKWNLETEEKINEDISTGN